MTTNENIKDLVRQKYSEIAHQDKATNQSSCCGSGCCSTEVYNIMSDDYSHLEGYDPNADLNSNGIVDLNDLVLIARQLPSGTSCQ